MSTSLQSALASILIVLSTTTASLAECRLGTLFCLEGTTQSDSRMVANIASAANFEAALNRFDTITLLTANEHVDRVTADRIKRLFYEFSAASGQSNAGAVVHKDVFSTIEADLQLKFKCPPPQQEGWTVYFIFSKSHQCEISTIQRPNDLQVLMPQMIASLDRQGGLTSANLKLSALRALDGLKTDYPAYADTIGHLRDFALSVIDRLAR